MVDRQLEECLANPIGENGECIFCADCPVLGRTGQRLSGTTSAGCPLSYLQMLAKFQVWAERLLRE